MRSLVAELTSASRSEALLGRDIVRHLDGQTPLHAMDWTKRSSTSHDEIRPEAPSAAGRGSAAEERNRQLRDALGNSDVFGALADDDLDRLIGQGRTTTYPYQRPYAPKAALAPSTPKIYLSFLARNPGPDRGPGPTVVLDQARRTQLKITWKLLATPACLTDPAVHGEGYHLRFRKRTGGVYAEVRFKLREKGKLVWKPYPLGRVPISRIEVDDALTVPELTVADRALLTRS